MNIAVIGYGNRGKCISDILLKLNSDIRLVAINDTNVDAIQEALKERSLEARLYTNVDEMLDKEQLDGVIIGTRCSLHTQMAIKVLKKRIPLILEKPVSTSMGDLLALKEVYEMAGTEVAVPFSLRLSNLGRAAKKILDSGRLGAIEHVQVMNNVSYGSVYFQSWYRDENETGGLFLQKATHDFDMINYMLGLRPTQLCAMKAKQIFKGNKPANLKCENCEEQYSCPESATLHRLRGEPAHHDMCCFAVDTGNEDSGSAIIEYETGMHASYSQNFYVRKKAGARTFRFIGYEGTLEFDYFTSQIKVFMHHEDHTEVHDIGSSGDDHGGGDVMLCENFIEMMQGGKSKTPLDAGLLSVLMCLKAKEASITKMYQEIKW
jgi:predicted dehydrogenase